MSASLDDLVRQLEETTAATIAALRGLSEDDLSGRTGDGRWSVRRFLLHELMDHERVHAAQLLRLRRKVRGYTPPAALPTEAERMVMDTMEARAKVVGVLAILNQEDLEANPGEGEWTVRQVIEHLIQVRASTLRRVQEIGGKAGMVF